MISDRSRPINKNTHDASYLSSSQKSQKKNNRGRTNTEAKKYEDMSKVTIADWQAQLDDPTTDKDTAKSLKNKISAL
jgi:hypothetical protein